MVHFEGLKEFTIKLASNDDTSKIIKMLKGIAQWMKDNKINQWGYLLQGGDDEEIAQAIADGETYIVLKDNGMVATFTLATNQSYWDRHIWGEDHTLKSVYLHRLAIIPSYMKRGLGRSLLNWIQNNVRDQEYLKLDCVADNDKLNNFYKNNEFELVGITDNHCKYQKKLKNN